MNSNFVLPVLVATAGQFIFGAIWYMPLFGNLWGKIHNFPAMTKAKQNEMRKQMMPMLVVQFLVTVMTSLVLFKALEILISYNPYLITFGAWLGFVVPTQVSAVIFGGTNEKWILHKIAIMAIGALGCLMLATFLIKQF